jgi:murein DD-endopeptidase MepM/ murein hydrolase activator NlpD
MNEQHYLIEILLRARDLASPLIQKAVASVKDVAKAEDKMAESSKRATAAMQEQRRALQDLYASHVRDRRAAEDSATARRNDARAARENAAALRAQAAEKRASIATDRQEIATLRESARTYATRAAALQRLADARRQQSGGETDAVRKLQQAANAQTRLANNELRTANARERSIRGIANSAASFDKEAAAVERSAAAFERSAGVHERASTRSARSIASVADALSSLDRRSSSSERTAGRFGRTIQRLGIQTDGTRSSLRGLNAEFQGFQLAIVIKYAQSLLSTLIALGAQLVAVAAAAGQAAAGLGAAFGAAAAQAVPVVGVLAAAFGRLTAVLKAVRLQNQQQLTDTHNAATAARRQVGAADQIRNAQQQVADAHRNVGRAVQDLARAEADAARQEVQAQNDVTRARKDAIRTVQDLLAAERDAQVQLLQAQQQLRGAQQGGDVLGTLAAFDAQQAAQRGVTRARQDAAPVRARGVEGVDAVQQAEQRVAEVRRTNAQQIASAEQQVADAQRQSRRAEQDLARTRVEATQNIAQETAAADKLTNSIKLLSPAEQHLYRRILALQETYRRAVRPITDIITRAFTGVVDRVNALLHNPQIMRGFRNIAVEIAGSIRQATSEAGGQRSVGVFELLQREATRNIPIVTRIAINFFRTLRSLVVDSLPAFRLLLGYVDGYARGLRRAVETHPGQLRDFFVQGVRYANQFFRLGLAVVRLLLAIGGRGGAAAEGSRTIGELTDYVDHLTDRVNHNAGSIRRFFASTHDSVKEVLGVLGALATTLFSAFDPRSIETLADFLRQVIIPALGTTIRVMGVLVNAFHQFLTLPGVTQIAELAATFLLMARGLDVINHAFTSVLQILPNFLRGLGLMVAEGEVAEGTFLGLGIAMGGWVLIIGGAVVAAIVLLNRHFHFLGPTFRWLKGAAKDTFDFLKNAARSVVRWFEDVWNQGLLKWIRYPFQHAGDTPAFHAIIAVAKTVIGFFSGSLWATLKALIVTPFELARVAIDIIWGLIQTIVEVALDLLAGRFERIGPRLAAIWSGIWDGIRSALVTALNTLIDLVNAAIDDINKVSPFGDIGKIGKVSDDAAGRVADATDKMTDHYDKVGDKASDNADRVQESMKRISDATDKASKSSARSFDQLFKSVHVSLQDIKDVVRINSEDIASTLGKNSAAGKEAMADNFRKAAAAVKRQMDAGEVSTKNGMRAIRGYLTAELQTYGLSLRQARTLAAARSRGDTTTSMSGGPEEGTAGPFGHYRAGGGMVSNMGGWPRDDHMVMDPYGRVTAMVSGNEGIINPPQMDRINQWGAIVKGLGLDSYGSLQDMWGMRGGGQLRHFQRGGKLQLPTTFSPTHQTAGLSGYPAIDVFGRPGQPVGSPTGGRVVKLSGRSPSAGAYQGAGGPFGWSEYISGGGRTYFLTHFGSRAVSLGQSVRRGQIIGTVGDYPGGTPDHIHEGLHGGAKGVVPGGAANVAPTMLRRIQAPRVVGGGAVGAAVDRVLRISAAAANRFLGRSTATRGGNFPAGDTSPQISVPPGANGAALMRAISRRRGWNFNDWWGIDAIETSHGANLANPTSTARLRGQFLSSNWGRYGPGSDPRLRPSMAQQIASMASYIAQRYGNPTRALQHEHSFGWYKRGGPLRRLQDGGPLKGVARPARIRAVTPLAASLTRALSPINTLMDSISSALEAVARGPLRRSQHLAVRITRAFTAITGDGGILDKISDAVEAIATRATAALQRRQFRVGRGGPRRIYQSPADEAQAQLQTLQSTRTALVDEQRAIQSSLTDAQHALTIAQRRHNARAAAVARAAIDGLRTRQSQVAQSLAQNAQDQVETQESFQQALLDSVTTAADQQNSAIDRWSRTAKALGHTIDPNVVLNAQIANMQRESGGLRGVLARAMRTGNLELATTVRAQIDELNVQIAEAVAQRFQNAIDAVNNEAARQTARLDRATRRAQIGGQTDFAAMQGILGQRQGVLATQRAGLQTLIDQAFRQGNVDQFNNLGDQIDELDIAMAENTQAIKDNSDAAFNLATQMINDRAGFATGIFSSAQGFFQALTQATGLDTSAQQLAALQATNATLADQQAGLRDQMAALLDFTPDWQQWLRNLSGADLVGYLSSLVASPTFSAYLDTLDQTQQQSFRDLISSLIGNATAVEQNTQAITDLTGATTQTFASSFWTAFRTAVFTGEGRLLPQYQMTIPGADIGARVINAGALMVHAGEVIRPATIQRGGDQGGDIYHLNVTTPTEVLDPVDVNRQLAFLRKTSGR